MLGFVNLYTPGNSAKFDEPPQYRGRRVSYRFILRGTTEGDCLAVTSDEVVIYIRALLKATEAKG